MVFDNNVWWHLWLHMCTHVAYLVAEARRVLNALDYAPWFGLRECQHRSKINQFTLQLTLHKSVQWTVTNTNFPLIIYILMEADRGPSPVQTELAPAHRCTKSVCNLFTSDLYGNIVIIYVLLSNTFSFQPRTSSYCFISFFENGDALKDSKSKNMNSWF